MNLFTAVFAPVRVLLGVLDFGCEVRRELSRWEAHEDALNAAEADVDHLEPGELRHRLYCNKCGGGYWTAEHDCGRNRGSEPPHLSWGRLHHHVFRA